MPLMRRGGWDYWSAYLWVSSRFVTASIARAAAWTMWSFFVVSDPRLSPNDWDRWRAVRATRCRCRHCYADIVQSQPDGPWRDVDLERGQCAPNVWHDPLPVIV